MKNGINIEREKNRKVIESAVSKLIVSTGIINLDGINIPYIKERITDTILDEIYNSIKVSEIKKESEDVTINNNKGSINIANDNSTINSTITTYTSKESTNIKKTNNHLK